MISFQYPIEGYIHYSTFNHIALIYFRASFQFLFTRGLVPPQLSESYRASASNDAPPAQFGRAVYF